MRRYLLVILLSLLVLPAYAQMDKKEVRAGNRKFKKEKFKEAEIDYRRAVLADSTSMKANYNLASALYEQQDYDGAASALQAVKNQAAPSQYHFNAGDVALQKKDYAAAVQSFKQALLQDPADLTAKESYIYAKKMLENQQQQQDQQQQNQQDQQDDQNDQNDQNQDQQPQQQPQEPNEDQQKQQAQQQPQSSISQQQARQMLNAIQAREKETQEKVNKEKAELLKSKQKEKNW